MLTLRTLLRANGAIFVGGERSASTSRGEGTRDGEDIVRLVRTYPSCQHQALEAHDHYNRWTGEVGGRSGLFPALYVKLL